MFSGMSAPLQPTPAFPQSFPPQYPPQAAQSSQSMGGYGSAPQFGYAPAAGYGMSAPSMPMQMQMQPQMQQLGVQQTPFGPLSTMQPTAMHGGLSMPPAPMGSTPATGMMAAPPNAQHKEDAFAFLD